MTDPKQISDFAKEYQQMYIGFTQCKSMYEIVLKQRDEANQTLEMERKALQKAVERQKKYAEIMQLRQQAVIDFCNEKGYEPVAHFIYDQILDFTIT